MSLSLLTNKRILENLGITRATFRITQDKDKNTTSASQLTLEVIDNVVDLRVSGGVSSQIFIPKKHSKRFRGEWEDCMTCLVRLFSCSVSDLQPGAPQRSVGANCDGGRGTRRSRWYWLSHPIQEGCSKIPGFCKRVPPSEEKDQNSPRA